MIKEAIHNNTIITFLYYSNKGDTKRIVEPYYLTFRWSAWYLFGYCLDRNDFRLFKLNRLWELSDTGTKYIVRNIPEDKKNLNECFTDELQVEILFDERVKYRLIDEYGVNCYTLTDSGKLLFQRSFTNKDFLVSWVLGFGDMAEVVSPPKIREEIGQIVEKLQRTYHPSDT
nr:WYL domain-containing protein [Mobilitalea sibirica]